MSGLNYEVVEGWEQLPQGYRHLDVPGIAVDSRDRVYLFTRDDARVIVYERDGTFVTSWGEGLFPGRTHGITIGPDGSVYCANEGDHTVLKFSPDGQLLMTIGVSGVASDTGSFRDGRPVYDRVAAIERGGPPFNQPTDIAVAPNGELYVSDGYGNARVHRFTADGKLIQSWGEPGTGPGQFHLPHGICIDGDGRVLVADRENDRIQIFSPNGEFLDQWTDFSRPADIAIDRQGLIYVGECRWKLGGRSFVHGPIEEDSPGRVSVLDARGKVLARLGTTAGCIPANFWSAHAICVDSVGDLYVGENLEQSARKHGRSSAGYSTVQKFARKGLASTSR